MLEQETKHSTGLNVERALLVVALMAALFMGAYHFAFVRNQNSFGSTSTAVASTQSASSTGGPIDGSTDGSIGGQTGGSIDGSTDGCCGSGDGGASVKGSTKVANGVQTINVDTSQGVFNPNVIKVKAGVPVVINFSKSDGGCLSGVYMPDFNVNEDLTSGGKTVKLPAMKKGTYTFYCQMRMVSAQIVAE
ncbi:MAG: cupredoxin domain-containing protein [Coriobacteriia bacterium]|nr:cupredoxin domain-containing protein [Coriobacteriia bacterium]